MLDENVEVIERPARVTVEDAYASRDEVVADQTVEKQPSIESVTRQRPGADRERAENDRADAWQNSLAPAAATEQVDHHHDRKRHQNAHTPEQKRSRQKRTEPQTLPRLILVDRQGNHDEQEEQREQRVGVCGTARVHVQKAERRGEDGAGN